MESNTKKDNKTVIDVHESEALLVNVRNMSRQVRRKFNKRIRDLKETLKLNPDLFDRRWNKLVKGWLHEAHRRANAWGIPDDQLKDYTKEQLIDMGKLEVFEVVEIAKSVIEACGPEISEKVGAMTVNQVTNECIKAVAGVVDHRLNFMVDKRIYRRIKK